MWGVCSQETKFVCFRILIFIFTALFLKLHLLYAESLSYEDVIKSALRNSPRVKVKFYDINIAHANYKQSLSNFYPQIYVGSRIEKFENLAKTAGFITAGGQVIGGQPNEWRATMYLSAEYYISNWYKRWFDASYYRLLKDVALYECQTEMKRLAINITDLYSQILEAKIKLYYSDLILEKLKKVYELKKISYAKG